MKAKANYWGGPVCIERLRFVNVPGGEAAYDAFTTGELTMAYLAEPKAVADAEADGHDGYRNVASGSNYLVMNNGVRGTESPLKDPRIRQAVAAAINVEIINDRVNGGEGLPSSAIIWEGLPIDPGIDGPPYDLALATRLVTEVKGEGWDGRLRLTANNTPQTTELSITVEAMLEAAGMTIDVENLPVAEANRKVLIEPDFDLGFSGLSIYEESPYARLDQFETGNVRTRTGFSDPRMDTALQGLRRAATRAEKKTAMGEVQRVWNETIPSTVLWSTNEFVVADDSVHGVIYSRDTVPLFHRAYLS